jgi:hypothetical protein
MRHRASPSRPCPQATIHHEKSLSAVHFLSREIHHDDCDRTPLKSGVHHLKIDWGIPDEARMHKHTYATYKDVIKVLIKLLHLCLENTR